MKQDNVELTIVALEKPIFEDSEECYKIWFRASRGSARLPPEFGIVNSNFLLQEVMRVTNVTAPENVVGKQLKASIEVDRDKIRINNIRNKLMNANVNEGKNWLQVEECREGKSKTSGNEYWCLKCLILSNPKATRTHGAPIESFNVYFMKDKDWALQNLQNVVLACGADKPWQLSGKRFIADVVIKNDFVSLKNPRPYTEDEPPETEGGRDINAPTEWPF